jgi:hypothetical protein
MKSIIGSLFCLFLVITVNAETLTIGGNNIEIPAPEGYSIVTPKMDALYRFSLQMADPMNDQLAFYINESDVPLAISGEIPSLERYFLLKISKDLKKKVVGLTISQNSKTSPKIKTTMS